METTKREPMRRDVVTSLMVAAAAIAIPGGATAATSLVEGGPTGPMAGSGVKAQKVVIMPSFDCCERYEKIAEENTYTIVYEVMDRFDFETNTVTRAHVSSDLYREWLRDYPTDNGIPPHIHFGGGIVVNPKGDPTFKDRWVRRTLAKLKTGELA